MTLNNLNYVSSLDYSFFRNIYACVSMYVDLRRVEPHYNNLIPFGDENFIPVATKLCHQKSYLAMPTKFHQHYLVFKGKKASEKMLSTNGTFVAIKFRQQRTSIFKIFFINFRLLLMTKTSDRQSS